jgi:hypothetical protein
MMVKPASFFVDWGVFCDLFFVFNGTVSRNQGLWPSPAHLPSQWWDLHPEPYRFGIFFAENVASTVV